MLFRLHHPSMASNSVRYEVVLQVPISYHSPSVDSTPLSCACLSVTRPRLEEKQCAIVFFRKMSVSRTKTQTHFFEHFSGGCVVNAIFKNYFTKAR